MLPPSGTRGRGLLPLLGAPRAAAVALPALAAGKYAVYPRNRAANQDGLVPLYACPWRQGHL